jgi:hypothetical protein
MMKAEMVSETVGFYPQLTQLAVQEEFIDSHEFLVGKILRIHMYIVGKIFRICMYIVINYDIKRLIFFTINYMNWCARLSITTCDTFFSCLWIYGICQLYQLKPIITSDERNVHCNFYYSYSK